MEAGVAKALEQGADLIELRLDGLRDLSGWQKLLRADIPIILTNRAECEGGHFKGDERSRVKPLLDGIAEGVACVDIEFSTLKQHLDEVSKAAKQKGTSVLVSYHDFSTTPPVDALIDIARRMADTGCDLVKIITFAKEPRDALRVLDFLAEVQNVVTIPVVAFAMGDVGKLSRIAAPLLGSPIVYAAAAEVTAPGQFDVVTAKRLMRELGLKA
jgi:3-dehydroquinate dehydratase-1